jgi:hypothetical protein
MTNPPRNPIEDGFISRKTLAQLLGPECSVGIVRKNERHWGIDRARVDFNCRCVRYRYVLVLRILRAKGILE